MNLTRTSCRPLASDKYATHFPSGEMAVNSARRTARQTHDPREHRWHCARVGGAWPLVIHEARARLTATTATSDIGDKRPSQMPAGAGDWGSRRRERICSLERGRQFRCAHPRCREVDEADFSRGSGAASRARRGGVRAGSAFQSGSRSSVAAMQIRRRAASEHWRAREHFVDDTPEAPDVGPFVDDIAARLFRTHVRRGPQDPPGPMASVAAPVVSDTHRPAPRPRETEVQNFQTCRQA